MESNHGLDSLGANPHRLCGDGCGGHRHRRMNILIVEDEYLIAEELRSALEELGHVVVDVAATHQAALHAVLQTDADLAFVDTRLAGVSSQAVVAACLQRGLPVIISSGHHRDALPAFAQGKPLLAKPFGRNEIAAVLDELLKRAPET